MMNLYELMNNPNNSPRDYLYYNIYELCEENHREQLKSNPDATVDELMEILSNSDEWLRAGIASHAQMPKSVIDNLLFDEVPEVRLAAIMNPQTSFEVFKEAVLVDEYKNTKKRLLAYSPNSLKSLEIFTTLWNIKAGDTLVMQLIYELKRLLETQTIIPPVIQSLMDFVNANIHTQTIRTREDYACAHSLATAEAMDKMKNDPSLVVAVAISANPNAWGSTQRRIFEIHGQNPTIRKNLAENTKNNSLLNEIYKEHKGKQNRTNVSSNPAFVLLREGN